VPKSSLEQPRRLLGKTLASKKVLGQAKGCRAFPLALVQLIIQHFVAMYVAVRVGLS